MTMTGENGQAYNIRVLRALLTRAFTPQTLQRFCHDRKALRPICDEFSPDDGLNDMVDEIVVFCEAYRLFDYLLAEIKLVNPSQYAYFEKELRILDSGTVDARPAGDAQIPGEATPRNGRKDNLTTFVSIATILTAIVAIFAFGRDVLDWTWLPGQPKETLTKEPSVVIVKPTSPCPEIASPPLPARPAFFKDYPATIVDFLNVGGTAAGLENALRDWKAITYEDGVVRSEDLTGDAVPEIVIILVEPSDVAIAFSQDVLIFMCDAGAYKLAYQARASDIPDPLGLTFKLKDIKDVNQSGRSDVVYVASSCGENTCWDALYVVEWNGYAFINRTPAIQAYAYPGFTLGDGQIIIDIGGSASVSSGAPREHKQTWTWNGTVFTMTQDAFGPPLVLIHYIHDGDNALAAGRFADAIDSYGRAMMNTTMSSGLYFEGQMELDREIAEPRGQEIVQAYAQFKRMVAYAALENRESAEQTWWLLESTPSNSSGYPFVTLGRAFWDTYSRTGSPEEGCSAVVALAQTDLGPSELLFSGYGNKWYQPIDLCNLP